VNVAACLKWVDLRPELDGAHVRTDARTSGASPADRAALECALRAAEAVGGRVVAVTAGPPEAEAVLRDALACGASAARRVALPLAASADAVARGIALAVTDCVAVWCGDASLDRGSGSVPAFLAAELGLPQALGLVEVMQRDDGIDALRRLDGGRRERLRISEGRAVFAVEGATARLRRASLDATLAASAAPIEVVDRAPARDGDGVAVVEPVYRPFRPRARVLAPPAGDTALDRIRALTEAEAVSAHAEVVALAPPAAADRILAALASWGYDLPASDVSR
jgi:electron transfer flavoprotein beta subunit